MPDCWKVKMTRREADGAKRRMRKGGYVYKCPIPGCKSYHLTAQPQGLDLQRRDQQYGKVRHR